MFIHFQFADNLVLEYFAESMNPQYSQLPHPAHNPVPPPPAGNYNGSQPNVITSYTSFKFYIR